MYQFYSEEVEMFEFSSKKLFYFVVDIVEFEFR